MDIEQQLAEVIAEDEQPAVVTIYQPDGEPYRAADGSEATMSLLGSESKKVRQAQDRALRRLIRQRSRGQNEVEEARQNRIEVATAALVAWHGWEIGGKPAVLTAENAAKVFRVQHILQQVEEVVSGHARFFKSNSPA